MANLGVPKLPNGEASKGTMVPSSPKNWVSPLPTYNSKNDSAGNPKCIVMPCVFWSTVSTVTWCIYSNMFAFFVRYSLMHWISRPVIRKCTSRHFNLCKSHSFRIWFCWPTWPGKGTVESSPISKFRGPQADLKKSTGWNHDQLLCTCLINLCNKTVFWAQFELEGFQEKRRQPRWIPWEFKLDSNGIQTTTVPQQLGNPWKSVWTCLQ